MSAPTQHQPDGPTMVTCTIDGIEVSVPENTLIIRAAEQIGVCIPRFCDHPLLEPVGACRQCLVDIPDMGNGKPMPKPAASCTTTVMPGMVVRTQATSAVADKAQRGIMEMLLLNHPLDCPVCDKGGECPLQNQAMSNGRPETRYDGPKRVYPKPIPLSSTVLLDRERCVLCARCTRFSEQIAGDAFIELLERGALQQVGISSSQPLRSYFSGNTVQICPVGALTSTSYRFRARPFDLRAVPTTCEHCASGCALRTDVRRGVVLRRQAGVDPAVNEEWNCDKGRWATQYTSGADRLSAPLVRDDAGELVATSWPDALATAAEGLLRAQSHGGVGVLAGGRLTCEDAHAYSRFARQTLGTNDVDFRARPIGFGDEEESFLRDLLRQQQSPLTYADLESAGTVILAGFEPEDESPIVFLRLRKASRRRKNPVRVVTFASWASPGSAKLNARVVATVPGQEASALDAFAGSDLAGPVIVLVGQRLAAVPAALGAVARLAQRAHARLAWIPRRAGEPGAAQAGLLPSLLPGGRLVSDEAARADVATVWGVDSLPSHPGRDVQAMLVAAAHAQLGGLVVAGFDPNDCADPQLALNALEQAGFVVSLELRRSQVSDRADVVFPVAAVTEKSGSFLTWEFRRRPFAAALPEAATWSDARVLEALAQQMGLPWPSGAPVSEHMQQLGSAGFGPTQPRLPAEAGQPAEPDQLPTAPAAPPVQFSDPQEDLGADPDRLVEVQGGQATATGLALGEAVLSTWAQLLDAGSLQDHEPYLAASARPVVARLSPVTATEIGLESGDWVRVSSDRGAILAPVQLVAMPARVVWLPTNSPGCQVGPQLAATHGSVVRLARASAPTQPEQGGQPQ